jgi:hypothetical protein
LQRLITGADLRLGVVVGSGVARPFVVRQLHHASLELA